MIPGEVIKNSCLRVLGARLIWIMSWKCGHQNYACKIVLSSPLKIGTLYLSKFHIFPTTKSVFLGQVKILKTTRQLCYSHKQQVELKTKRESNLEKDFFPGHLPLILTPKWTSLKVLVFRFLAQVSLRSAMYLAVCNLGLEALKDQDFQSLNTCLE